jgi:hypothetical protein
MEPEYPYDLEELKQIERLLDKVPIYKAKIAELSEQIDALARKASKAGAYSDIQTIDKLIHKAFYIDVENRPFNSTESESIARLKAEIAWHDEIKNRNIPCEICGENRSIDRCHIIPSKLYGSQESNNLLFLCPTHHRLFDRFMLSKSEWAQIDWGRKSIPSQQYAMDVTLEAHKVFWEKLSQSEYEKIAEYQVNERAYVRHVVDTIGHLFISGRLVNASTICNLLDVNIRDIAITIIEKLVSAGVFKQIKSGGQNMLVLASKTFQVSDDLVMQIWQEIA